MEVPATAVAVGSQDGSQVGSPVGSQVGCQAAAILDDSGVRICRASCGFPKDSINVFPEVQDLP